MHERQRSTARRRPQRGTAARLLVRVDRALVDALAVGIPPEITSYERRVAYLLRLALERTQTPAGRPEAGGERESSTGEQARGATEGAAGRGAALCAPDAA